MTVLVTAATGNVGQQIFKQLVAAGEQARIFVRDEAKARAIVPQGDYQLVIGDYHDIAALNCAMNDVSAVYLAILDQFQDDLTYLENVISSARDAGVRRFVLMSAFKIEDLADMPFARRHQRSEELLRNCGIDCTVLRPDWFMQNFLRYVKNGQIDLPMGKGRNSFIDTADIAAVAIAALKDSKHAGHIYELTGPEALSHDDVAHTIAELTGRKCVYNDIDPELVKQGLLAQGYEEWYVNMYIDITAPMRAKYVHEPTNDIETILNRKPASLEEFVRANLDEFRIACPE